MSAIAYLHSNHVAHRDVKPDNLLIDFHGNLKVSLSTSLLLSSLAQVSDFGVSSYFSNEKEKEFKSLRLLSHSASRGVVRKTEGIGPFPFLVLNLSLSLFSQELGHSTVQRCVKESLSHRKSPSLSYFYLLVFEFISRLLPPLRHNAYMSDLWACAVCLWIFIFGVLPFQHENILILFEIIRSDLSSLLC
jgi:serine/threonine protein kinase